MLGTGNGDNLMTTQFGLSPGYARRRRRLSLLELPSQHGPVPVGRRFRQPITYDIDFKVFQAFRRAAGGETVQMP